MAGDVPLAVLFCGIGGERLEDGVVEGLFKFRLLIAEEGLEGVPCDHVPDELGETVHGNYNKKEWKLLKL